MSAYYNDNDRHAAAWLRELIRAGHIPPGDVDTRSIEDVTPNDIKDYTQHHFFAGIGGWPYALRLAGWPDDRPVWTASCPCQPFSGAGAGAGYNDPRHLWPAVRWLAGQCQPAIIFGEQVASPLGRDWLARVQTDMEALGYATAAADLCAAGISAPHIRPRLWWVGYADGAGREPRQVPAEGARFRGALEPTGTDGRLDHADRARLERHRRDESDRGESRRHETAARGPAAPPGGDGRMGDARSATRERHPGSIFGAEASGDSTRLEDGRGVDGHSDAGEVGFDWGDDWIPCADGKYRRIKPGIEPVVNGLPGRMGLLRGYGNAIVPQVAKIFIEAVMSYEIN